MEWRSNHFKSPWDLVKAFPTNAPNPSLRKQSTGNKRENPEGKFLLQSQTGVTSEKEDRSSTPSKYDWAKQKVLTAKDALNKKKEELKKKLTKAEASEVTVDGASESEDNQQTPRRNAWSWERIVATKESLNKRSEELKKKSSAWIKENLPTVYVMGACLSSNPQAYIEDNDGGEEDFHKRFLEDRVLGEGQFGVVTLVHDMTANNGEGELMACKTLKKGVVFKDNTIYTPLKPSVMQTECNILRTLAGRQYCLDLIAIYETPRILMMVTEYCSGGEMMEYVSKQEELRTEDASRIAFQLLSAVDHCAQNKVLHRDIKPENTMFKYPTRGADLRLIDFGSGVKDPDTRPPDEFHETFAGTAFYISPEMFQHKYTQKTDVWSAGATICVLVAGYPAGQLQKAFNILQKKNDRNLRNIPGMTEDLPDSFIDLLDKLLTYRHRDRPTAGDMLSHEFVQFHKTLNSEGINLEDIAAEAAGTLPFGEGDIERRRKRTQSMKLTGSIQAHSMFLNYQQFARSVTTILATMLTKAEFDVLLEKLNRYVVEERKEFGKKPDEEDEASNKEKLQIIRINELKAFLEEMDLKKVLSMIEKLPDSGVYSNFAYQIKLLRQFKRSEGKNRRSTYRRSVSYADGKNNNSVHGYKVYDRSKSTSRTLKRATSAGNLNASVGKANRYL